MKLSKISWCDYSGGNLNMVLGCTPASTGCANCYGRRLYERWGKNFSEIKIYPEKLERLRKQSFPQYSPKRGAPHKPVCFVCDMSDLFHAQVPAEFIAGVFDLMGFRDDVIWLVLTKRPERIRDVLYGEEGRWYLGGGDYLPNVWLGTSVENQEMAEKRLPHLLALDQGWPLWVSVEPCLEAIDLTPSLWTCTDCGVHPFDDGFACWRWNGEVWQHHHGSALGHANAEPTGIDWVVCGAESGPNRRPFDVAWAEDLYRQCEAAGVAYWGKQDSGLRPGEPLLIDGREIHQWPEGM